jgi:Uma2 family endonuclease
MSVRVHHRFTVEDYYRMAEVGVIARGARVELLDGQLVDMMPIGPFHSGVVDRLVELFSEQNQQRWSVRAQNPLRLDKHSEPQPDVMLLKRRADSYTRNHPVPDDVFLIIEVADSSLDLDQCEKLPVYGKAGIPEVWIVNLPERHIEVYREPHFAGYAKADIIREGENASPSAFPDVQVSVAALLA